jgi:hypothetical protein
MSVEPIKLGSELAHLVGALNCDPQFVGRCDIGLLLELCNGFARFAARFTALVDLLLQAGDV